MKIIRDMEFLETMTLWSYIIRRSNVSKLVKSKKYIKVNFQNWIFHHGKTGNATLRIHVP